MKETNQQNEDTDTLHDVRRAHYNIPKTFLGTLSGRQSRTVIAKMTGWFSGSHHWQTDFLLMPERETTKPHINRKNKDEESEV